MRPEPVAVTGLGCICGAGETLPDCLASMFRGERAPKPPTRFATDHPVVYPVFELASELPLPGGRVDPLLSRTARLAITAAAEALADAGWSTDELRELRVGVCIGTTVGSALNSEEFYRGYKGAGQPDMQPVDRFLHSNPAAAVAREFQLDGPCQTVVNACSSGTDAIGIGAAWIRAGVCDLVLAGGSDELSRVTYTGFISLMITNEEPCRPFDVRRRGLNLGEGAGVLVLESERIRRKRARGTVLGYGSACDAYHLTAPHPEGKGLKQALQKALDLSGVGAAEVAFVNAHGTGTPDNDRVESRVLDALLPGVPFHSSKCFTGHTLGAAGGVEAAFTLACLEAGQIPANLGYAEPDPELPAAPVSAVTAIDGPVAISESLAFGGNNAVVVFGRGEA